MWNGPRERVYIITRVYCVFIVQPFVRAHAHARTYRHRRSLSERRRERFLGVRVGDKALRSPPGGRMLPYRAQPSKSLNHSRLQRCFNAVSSFLASRSTGGVRAPLYYTSHQITYTVPTPQTRSPLYCASVRAVPPSDSRCRSGGRDLLRGGARSRQLCTKAAIPFATPAKGNGTGDECASKSVVNRPWPL